MEVYNFTVGDGPEKDYWAEYSVFSTGDGECVASGFLFAPNKGDQIMAEVQQYLIHAAQLLSATVIHRFVAENPASELLAQRTNGYTYSGENKNGIPVYIKKFNP